MMMLPLKKKRLAKIRISQLLYELQFDEKSDLSQKNIKCWLFFLYLILQLQKQSTAAVLVRKFFCKYAANLQENTDAAVSFKQRCIANILK